MIMFSCHVGYKFPIHIHAHKHNDKVQLSCRLVPTSPPPSKMARGLIPS